MGDVKREVKRESSVLGRIRMIFHHALTHSVLLVRLNSYARNSEVSPVPPAVALRYLASTAIIHPRRIAIHAHQPRRHQLACIPELVSPPLTQPLEKLCVVGVDPNATTVIIFCALRNVEQLSITQLLPVSCQIGAQRFVRLGVCWLQLRHLDYDADEEEESRVDSLPRPAMPA